jgi:hypothetical protein
VPERLYLAETTMALNRMGHLVDKSEPSKCKQPCGFCVCRLYHHYSQQALGETAETGVQLLSISSCDSMYARTNELGASVREMLPLPVAVVALSTAGVCHLPAVPGKCSCRGFCSL